MTKILLADDHDLVREGLKRIIESESDLEIVAEAADWTEVLAGLDGPEFDVLVTDITMPGPGFVHAMETIGRRMPDLPILVVSMHSEDLWKARAFALGVTGYLNKSRSAEQLIEAVRAVARGVRYEGRGPTEHP